MACMAAGYHAHTPPACRLTPLSASQDRPPCSACVHASCEAPARALLQWSCLPACCSELAPLRVTLATTPRAAQRRRNAHAFLYPLPSGGWRLDQYQSSNDAGCQSFDVQLRRGRSLLLSLSPRTKRACAFLHATSHARTRLAPSRLDMHVRAPGRPLRRKRNAGAMGASAVASPPPPTHPTISKRCMTRSALALHRQQPDLKHVAPHTDPMMGFTWHGYEAAFEGTCHIHLARARLTSTASTPCVHAEAAFTGLYERQPEQLWALSRSTAAPAAQRSAARGCCCGREPFSATGRVLR